LGENRAKNMQAAPAKMRFPGGFLGRFPKFFDFFPACKPRAMASKK
jgi:hypothetical protein